MARGGQAATLLVEYEFGMIADGPGVATVGRLLFRAVDPALEAVDVQGQTPRERANPLVPRQIRNQALESLIVPLLEVLVQLAGNSSPASQVTVEPGNLTRSAQVGPSRGSSFSRSRRFAKLMRDFTVPTGIPSRSAISW